MSCKYASRGKFIYTRYYYDRRFFGAVTVATAPYAPRIDPQIVSGYVA